MPVGTDHVARATQALGTPAWTESQIIAPSDSQADDCFGCSIAMSGSTALVGASGRDKSRGAAYVFVRSGSRWLEQQRLDDANGHPGDQLGRAVALDGDTALVTAHHPGRGAAVFVRSGTSWTEQQTLFPSDGAPDGGFGFSAALSGDTALVGYVDPFAAGAAYAFVRSGSTWTEQQKLAPDDTADGDEFGSALALSGDTALVGAWNGMGRGAVYVFTRSAGVWTQQQKLTVSGFPLADGFGTALAIDGDTAVVGALGADYVLVRSGATWKEQQKLVPNEQFAYPGTRVALAGGTVLGGGRIGYGLQVVGAAFVFEPVGTSWKEQPTLAPVESDISIYDAPVALRPGLALVGGRQSDGADRHGVVVAFTLGPSNGTACTSDANCASTHCVDGVCCDTSCSGPCAACSVATGATADGKCSPLPEGSSPSSSCGRYLCDGLGDSCPRYCKRDDVCATGFACSAIGDCIPPAGECSADGSYQKTLDRNIDCYPFRCDRTTGKCATVCASDADCVPGYGCTPHGCENKEYLQPLCNCRVAGRRQKSDAPLALLLGLFAFGVRRSRC